MSKKFSHSAKSKSNEVSQRTQTIFSEYYNEQAKNRFKNFVKLAQTFLEKLPIADKVNYAVDVIL